jgi:hypothetical protein
MVGAGANPEHTNQQRPPYPDSHKHEHAGPTAHDGTKRQQPRPRVHVRDEEVAGSNPVTPTTSNGLVSRS